MKPVKPEECRGAPHPEAFAGRTMVALHEDAPRAAGVFRRVVVAIMRAQQRQAERTIARHFRALGGRLTDETERKLMERILSGRLF